MAFEQSEVRRLIVAAQAGLKPAPFPPRRDFDFSNAASLPDEVFTVFHDVVLSRTGGAFVFLARVDGGERGRLGAHVLRALLRAALHLHPAATALDLSLKAFSELDSAVSVDAAAASLCARTGMVNFGARGAGTALLLKCASGWSTLDPHAEGSAQIAAGEYCWLSIGASPPGLARGDDADALVRKFVAGYRNAAALVLGLKSLRVDRPSLFVLSNDVAEIGPVLAGIERHCLDVGVRPEALAGVDVALDEILTNIVLYAYGDGLAHEVAVEVHVAGDDLTVEIRDDGSPFDPTLSAQDPAVDAALDDRPVGGLGLHFVRTIFERMSYRRVGGWNILDLTRSLKAETFQERTGDAAGYRAAPGEVR